METERGVDPSEGAGRTAPADGEAALETLSAATTEPAADNASASETEPASASETEPATATATEPRAEPVLDIAPPQLQTRSPADAEQDDYEAWLAAERRATKFGRLTSTLGVMGGLAASSYAYSAVVEAARREREPYLRYLAPQKGLDENALRASGIVLLIAVLVAVSLGRLVKLQVLASAPSSRKPEMGPLALASFVLAGISAAAVAVFFLVRADVPDRWGAHRDETIDVAVRWLVSAIAFSGSFFLFTRSGQRASDASSLEERPRDTLDVGRRTAFGFVTVLVVPITGFGLSYGFDWRGLAPIAIALLASLVSWFVIEPMAARNADRDAARAEVEPELAAVRAAARHDFGAKVAAVIAGAGTFGAGIYLWGLFIEWYNRGYHAGGRMYFGVTHWFGLVALSVVAGLATHKLLGRKTSELDSAPVLDTGGIFDDTLAKTGGLDVRQQVSLATILFGGAAKARYQILDGGGAFTAWAVEQTGFLARLLLGGRRAVDVAVDDLGKTALRVRRPYLWFTFFDLFSPFNRATVTEGERTVGHITQRPSIVRRYSITDAHGREVFDLQSGFFFRGIFRVFHSGVQVGELRRVREPWYIRMFKPFWARQVDRFWLSLPQAAPLDDRRLLFGSLLLVDITHYPTQATFRAGVIGVVLLAILAALGGSEPKSDAYDRRHPPAYEDYDYDR